MGANVLPQSPGPGPRWGPPVRHAAPGHPSRSPKLFKQIKSTLLFHLPVMWQQGPRAPWGSPVPPGPGGVPGPPGARGAKSSYLYCSVTQSRWINILFKIKFYLKT